MSENSSDEIARQLAETRERLNKSVEELQDYVRPSNVASRGLGKINEFFVNEEGQPRPERIAAVGASLLAFFGIALKVRGKNSED
jgi:hypothetical protein